MSGTRTAITMIEGFAREMPEDDMLQAILFGHKHIVTVIDMIEELRDEGGPGAEEAAAAGRRSTRSSRSSASASPTSSANASRRPARPTAPTASRSCANSIFAEYLPEDGEAKYTPEQVSAAFDALEERVVRDLILEGKRIDGRNTKQLRHDHLRGRPCCRARTARPSSSAARRRPW